jgi:hypothetical protein
MSRSVEFEVHIRDKLAFDVNTGGQAQTVPSNIENAWIPFSLGAAREDPSKL